MTPPDIYNAYAAGGPNASVRILAKNNGVHFTALYRTLSQFNPFPIPGIRQKISNVDQLWICDLYHQGATLQMIADDWHVAIRTVSIVLDRHGVKRRPAGNRSSRKARYETPENMESYTIAELSRIIGTRQTWSQALKGECPEFIKIIEAKRLTIVATAMTKYKIKQFYKNYKSRKRA